MQQFGQYRIEGIIGSGGMGEVYRAYDTRRDREVALKLLPTALSDDPEYQRRFQRESYAVARLREPHVIPIHDYGEIDGRLFIDMRLVDGPNLGALIEPRRPAAARAGRQPDLPGRRGARRRARRRRGAPRRQAQQRARHAQRVRLRRRLRHRARRRAHPVQADDDRRHASAPSTTWPPSGSRATRSTRAPTCTRSPACSSSASRREKPFVGDDLPALMYAHLYTPPRRVSAVNPAVGTELDAVIAKGMAKKPADRYPSTGALAAAARAALDDVRRADRARRGDHAARRAPVDPDTVAARPLVGAPAGGGGGPMTGGGMTEPAPAALPRAAFRRPTPHRRGPVRPPDIPPVRRRGRPCRRRTAPRGPPPDSRPGSSRARSSACWRWLR